MSDTRIMVKTVASIASNMIIDQHKDSGWSLKAKESAGRGRIVLVFVKDDAITFDDELRARGWSIDIDDNGGLRVMSHTNRMRLAVLPGASSNTINLMQIPRSEIPKS